MTVAHTSRLDGSGRLMEVSQNSWGREGTKLLVLYVLVVRS